MDPPTPPPLSNRIPAWEGRDEGVGHRDSYAFPPPQERGGLCTPTHLQVEFSKRYLMDVTLIKAPFPAIKDMEWCVLLLSPWDNTFAAIDRSRNVAVASVTAVMVLTVAAIALAVTVMITRPIHRISQGMVSLSEYDIAEARTKTGDKSPFAELRSTQVCVC